MRAFFMHNLYITCIQEFKQYNFQARVFRCQLKKFRNGFKEDCLMKTLKFPTFKHVKSVKRILAVFPVINLYEKNKC